MNKLGVSLMISYVLLIFITVTLSIGVYIWLKDYAVVNEKTNCKDGTSLIIEKYNIKEEMGVEKITIFVKNNGVFNVDGFLITAGNNSQRIPMEFLRAENNLEGHYYFDPPLGPEKSRDAEFNVSGLDLIERIQLQPYILAENELTRIYCEDALIRQEILINPSLIQGLVSWWNFDGNVLDFGSNENDGGNNGAVYVDGKLNQGLEFDGNNDYVEIEDSGNLEPEKITISMWVYPKTWIHTTNVALITKRSSSENGFMFFQHNDGNLKVDFGGSVTRWDTGYLPPTNQWTHLIYTYDGTNGTLYVNGDYQSSTLLGDGSNIVSIGNLTIGSDGVATSYNFNGLIDEVAIHNRALSEWEVLQLYNSYDGII